MTQTADNATDTRTLAQRIGDKLARSMPDDAEQVARKSWIERRAQSILLGVITSIVSGLFIAVVVAFASVPGDIRELRRSNDTITFQIAGMLRADEANRMIADVRERGTQRDARLDKHDAALARLQRRVERVEYVIDIAPPLAPYVVRRNRAEAAAAAQAKPADASPTQDGNE